MPRLLAIDPLHDVQLAALGPGHAAAKGLPQHPEGGPDALLLRLRRVAEAELGREARDVARFGGVGRGGLDAGGGPCAGRGFARDDLQGARAGEAEVVGGGDVVLEFVVVADAGRGLVGRKRGRGKGRKGKVCEEGRPGTGESGKQGMGIGEGDRGKSEKKGISTR